MINIDYVLDLLDWNQSYDNQKEGLRLAREIKSVHVFLQPRDSVHNKNVWENCAIALSERKDEELRPYISNLMEWLVDMNWPGAFVIFNRLIQYEDKPWFNYVLSSSMQKAQVLGEDIWLENLENLRHKY